MVKLVAAADDYDTLIITVGGDGTVREAYQAISKIDQKGVYAHVPTGTTNDMAKNFNVTSKRCDEILSEIINGEITYIDTFSVNQKIAAYVSAFGFLSEVPYTTSPLLKKYLGHFGY